VRIYLDCYPCFLGQALRGARLSGANESQQYSVLKQTLTLLQNIRPGANPPEIGYEVHQIIRSIIDVPDPYREIKKTSTQQAQALYPKLKALIQQSDDPLDLAIRLSIAGNIIDFAVSDQVADLWETVERVIRQPYAIDDTAAFRDRLAAADHILYIADNAGETVFDRVLIEALPVPVTYVVKGGPVVNDAIMEDALAAGLDACSTVISNGAQASGTILSLCSESFRQRFHAAPLIIAKGQANFETLSDAGNNVFCLLQVKCPMIGAHLDVLVGSIVARQSTAFPPNFLQEV
jgi:damage-control phosphatase, subfamily I